MAMNIYQGIIHAIAHLDIKGYANISYFPIEILSSITIDHHLLTHIIIRTV